MSLPNIGIDIMYISAIALFFKQHPRSQYPELTYIEYWQRIDTLWESLEPNQRKMWEEKALLINQQRENEN